MSKTAKDLTAEELSIYRKAFWEREKKERESLKKRIDMAWELARKSARLLKEKFGATRVVVFGSLVHEGCFTRWSDIDIAAWGINPESTFKAVAEVMGLSPEIEINLVDVSMCKPSILKVILKEGVEL